MGVHGLTTLLRSSGLLPPATGRRRPGCLWPDSVTGDSDVEPTATEIIPPGSTLAVDGNGLAFHLHRVAYERHFSRSSGWGRDDCASATATPSQNGTSPKLLPTMMSLRLLDDVAGEFLSALTDRDVAVRVFFDGPGRRLKAAEDERRRRRREDQWSNLWAYCRRGEIPPGPAGDGGPGSGEDPGGPKSRTREGDPDVFLNSFPYSRLFLHQMRESLRRRASVSPTVTIVDCPEEADAEVARASAEGGGRTYAIGQDSDYIVFSPGGDGGEEEVMYAPLDALDASGADLMATVLRRTVVSETLGLPDSEAVIELSILLGNDYTSQYVRDKRRRKMLRGAGGESGDDPPLEDLDWYDPHAVISHLYDAGAGYRVASTSPEVQTAIDYTRALFGFGDVTAFPLDRFVSGSPIPTRPQSRGSPPPPPQFDPGLAAMTPRDERVLEAALRPLEALLESQGEGEGDSAAEDLTAAGWAAGAVTIRQKHIDAFRAASGELLSGSDSDPEPCFPSSPPDWDDVLAAHLIEKCVSVALCSGLEASLPVAMSASPFRVFDQAAFLAVLEDLALEDFPLRNEISSMKEKSFLEEVTGEVPASNLSTGVKSESLPIDSHTDEILDSVSRQRVTIIHGETGCGKSSRVPIMLLRAPPPEPTRDAPEVRMFVSQPRRIAAKTLAERVRSFEPDLSDRVALRMGHGVREYEGRNTRVWFVTTGYLVRLLANHPESFKSHTHLIIDEVHERSVDTDILCLLCRRLLVQHPTLRLLLMSATVAASLYSQYFGSPEPPIHVGSRRFPIKEYFVEDLSALLRLPPRETRDAAEIRAECGIRRCRAAPPTSHVQRMHRLAAKVAISVGSHGSSVLVFVPGMADIVEITEIIERAVVPGVTFVCLPIHSDVPFEEQMGAFESPGSGEVKIVIATNAAESSITLPDCDHVICLGLCKQITYDIQSHRQMLQSCWISKASAIQRAGRTGRVRDGNVYRLYSREVFEKYMEPYEKGEIVRIPLDSVILSLRDMLSEEVTPVLLQCLEPPDISNIERSFQSLHQNNFISDPNDSGDITSLGSLVVVLGIDLTLGALVGLGIQFGVAAETIQMAAILSFSKSPWFITNPLFHKADKYNGEF